MDTPHLTLSTATKQRKRSSGASKPLFRTEQPDGGAIGLTFAGQWIKGRGPYDVEIDVALLDGVFDCVGLALRGAGGNRRVDGELLRGVRVRELLQASVEYIETSGLAEMIAGTFENRGKPAGLYDELDEEGRRWYDQLPHAQQARDDAAEWRRLVREANRAGGRERLEVAAIAYNRAVRRGDPKPTVAVQKALKLATYDTAVGLVRRCRAQGLIPKTTKGRVTARKENEQ